MKDLLVQISTHARERELPFLLIGGNAVILLGVPRFTRDIDLMITDAYRDQWRELILDLGYKSYHQIDAFEQFEPSDESKEPTSRPGIDLALVEQSTWEKLYPAAHAVKLDAGESVFVPDVLHLIAMKLNAAQSPQRRLDANDLGDVVSLIKMCHIDIGSPEFLEIAERYGSVDDLDKIRRSQNDNA